MAQRPNTTPKRDPRLTDPRYDFRFYCTDDPVSYAASQLRLAFRIFNSARARGASTCNARYEIAYCNRIVWAARNLAAINAQCSI